MKKRNLSERIARTFKWLYLKLFRINDSPQKIALGFGLGVFLGVLPGMGPIVTIFMALFLRVNRASALIGCLLTNTWISIVAFLFSVKVGSVIMGTDWQNTRDAYLQLIKDLHWTNVFQLSVFKIMLPIVIGYFTVAFVFALTAYVIALLAATKFKQRKRRKADKDISGKAPPLSMA
jgi:uncharacterized protein